VVGYAVTESNIASKYDHNSLEQCEVNVNIYAAEMQSEIGGLVGCTREAQIENCKSSGNIVGGSAMGGIAGSAGSSSIINSSSSIIITGKSSLGGIVGSFFGKGSIVNCHATGDMNGNVSVGGLIGSSGNGKIINSSATGNVSGVGNLGGLIGGLAHSVEYIIEGCYATGDVTGNLSDGITNTSAGGLIGDVRATTATSLRLNKCYATGDVQCDVNVGGLVGRIAGAGAAKIENCYSTGSATGDHWIGGFVAFMDAGTIQNSYASGNVIGSGWTFLGGSDNWSRVTIQNSFSTGNVNGRIIQRPLGGFYGDDSFLRATIVNSSEANSYTGVVSYDIYKNWDQTVWQFPASPTFHPILKGITVDPAPTENLAPTVDTQITNLNEIYENTSSGEYTVAALLGSAISDNDNNSIGIAVTTAPSNSGSWQYNNGSGWKSMGSRTESSALLLNGADKIKFTPNANWCGQTGLIYRAWDGTDGKSSGDIADVATNGGSTAYSSRDGGIKITVKAGLNHAPTGSFQTTMANIFENTTSHEGQTVTSILNSRSYDADGNTLGIAVTHTGNDHGEWQYNDGSGWKSIGSPSSASALLLAASDKVRFIPNSNWTGSTYINFRVWDGTDGKNSGSVANTSILNGGSNAYSEEQSSTSLTVKVNTAPTLTGSVNMVPIMENTTNPSGQTISSLIGSVSSDADGHELGIAVTYINDTGGKWQYFSSGSWRNLDAALGSSAAFLLSANDRIRFKPNAGWSGDTYIRFRVWDGTDDEGVKTRLSSLSAGGKNAYSAGQQTINVRVNAAPVVETPVNPDPVSQDPISENSPNTSPDPNSGINQSTKPITNPSNEVDDSHTPESGTTYPVSEKPSYMTSLEKSAREAAHLVSSFRSFEAREQQFLSKMQQVGSVYYGEINDIVDGLKKTLDITYSLLDIKSQITNVAAIIDLIDIRKSVSKYSDALMRLKKDARVRQLLGDRIDDAAYADTILGYAFKEASSKMGNINKALEGTPAGLGLKLGTTGIKSFSLSDVGAVFSLSDLAKDLVTWGSTSVVEGLSRFVKNYATKTFQTAAFDEFRVVLKNSDHISYTVQDGVSLVNPEGMKFSTLMKALERMDNYDYKKDYYVSGSSMDESFAKAKLELSMKLYKDWYDANRKYMPKISKTTNGHLWWSSTDVKIEFPEFHGEEAKKALDIFK